MNSRKKKKQNQKKTKQAPHFKPNVEELEKVQRRMLKSLG